MVVQRVNLPELVMDGAPRLTRGLVEAHSKIMNIAANFSSRFLSLISSPRLVRAENMVAMKQCVDLNETDLGSQEPTCCLTSGTAPMLHARFAQAARNYCSTNNCLEIWYPGVL